MAKIKETPAEKAKRKAGRTPETRYQGLLNAQHTYALHKVTSAKAKKRKQK